jgi:hypothetical protein
VDALIPGRIVYALAAAYLQERRWFQDGDDPRIWMRLGDAARPTRVLTLGSALDVQLDDDGVVTNVMIDPD